jgi:UDP-GlcNAc3NAcA epimerase
MKIITILGTRPQFIKAAALSRVLKLSPGIEEILADTGQHYDDAMSQIFFRELEIPKPVYSLRIGSGTHGRQTGRMLAAVEDVLLREKPDWVMVYGDTNSTLAGALAASKLRIPLAHVEAGMRSFNRSMPEEVNRVVTDHISNLLFAPTRASTMNLLAEGIPPKMVRRVGDIMYEAALYYGQKAAAASRIMERLSLAPQKYILATIHRAENTDDLGRLKAIFDGLDRVGLQMPVILPLHPRTKKLLRLLGRKATRSDVRMIEPVGYLDMIMLEKNAGLIATDSGGIQKEAFFYRVPCVTLRDETEWTELVELGWNQVVVPRSARIVSNAILTSLERKGRIGYPYGRGRTAEAILSAMRQYSHKGKPDRI